MQGKFCRRSVDVSITDIDIFTRYSDNSQLSKASREIPRHGTEEDTYSHCSPRSTVMKMCLTKKVEHATAKGGDKPLPVCIDHSRCDPFATAVNDFNVRVCDEVWPNLCNERVFDEDICRIDRGVVAAFGESSDDATLE